MNTDRVIFALWLVLLRCTLQVSATCKSCIWTWTDNAHYNEYLPEEGILDSRCKDTPDQVTESCPLDQCYSVLMKYTLKFSLGYKVQHTLLRGCGSLEKEGCNGGADFSGPIQEKIDQAAYRLAALVEKVETAGCSCTGSDCNTTPASDIFKHLSSGVFLNENSNENPNENSNEKSNNSQPKSSAISLLLITMTTAVMVVNLTI